MSNHSKADNQEHSLTSCVERLWDKVYYLDFHQLYKYTHKDQRVVTRNGLDRNTMMRKRLKHQHYLCFYCGCEITMSDHLDHLVPVYYGGTNRPVNLVAACRACNMTKLVDQIEITNPYTINDYINMQIAKEKWELRVKKNPRLKRYQPKRVRLYGIYRADLFRQLELPKILQVKSLY